MIRRIPAVFGLENLHDEKRHMPLPPSRNVVWPTYGVHILLGFSPLVY